MSIVYETIYNKLNKILNFTELKEMAHIKLKSSDLMDLNFDFLFEDDYSFRIAMAHNYIQNGDVMSDPDMEIRIIPEMKMAEAMTYQQDNLGIYQIVYSGDGKYVNPEAKKELNTFLNQWLSNILTQNYQKVN